MQDKRNSAPRRVRAERGIYFRETPQGRRYEITFTDSTGRQRWQRGGGRYPRGGTSRPWGMLWAKLARGERGRSEQADAGTSTRASGSTSRKGKCRPKNDRPLLDRPAGFMCCRGSDGGEDSSITVDDVAAFAR